VFEYNASGSGGYAGGGFNPDPFGQWEADVRKNSSMNLMEYAQMNNPRVRAMERQAALARIGAKNANRMYDYLHYSSGGANVRFGSSLLQGMMGSGSFVDLAYGVQQSLPNAGMYMGMGNTTRMISGGGAANDAMAKMFYDRMTDHFYNQNGFGISTRTQGRDPTQISRAMQALSADGAFAGERMFTFGSKSLRDRLSDASSDLRHNNRISESNMVNDLLRRGGSDAELSAGIDSLSNRAGKAGLSGLVKSLDNVKNTNMGFTAIKDNIEKTGEKITDFFKLTDALADVYGKISEFETLDISRRITGGSSAGSIRAMTAKVQALKDHAAASGVDSQVMFERAAGAQVAYQQAGFGVGSSHFAMQTAILATIQNKSTLGWAGNATRQGLYRPTVTPETFTQRSAEEGGQIAMQKETRLGLEMRWRMTEDPGRFDTPEMRQAVEAMENAKNPRERAQAFANASRLMAPHGRLDISSEKLIAGISNSVHGEAYAKGIIKQTRFQKGLSFQHLAKNVAGDKTLAGFQKNGGRLLETLLGSFGGEKMDTIRGAIAAGDMARVREILATGDGAEVLARSGSSIDDVMGQIALVAGDMGGLGKLSSALTMGEAQWAAHGNGENFITQEALLQGQKDAAFNSIQRAKIGGDAAAGKASIQQTIFDNLVSGGTASLSENEVFRYAAAKGAAMGGIALDEKVGSLRFSDNQRDLFGKDAKFMGALGLSVGDMKGLNGILNGTGNATEIMKALGAAGFRTKMLEGDTNRMTLMSESQYEQYEGDLRKQSLGDYYSYITGKNLTDSERNTLAFGDPEKSAKLREEMLVRTKQMWKFGGKTTFGYNEEGGDRMMSKLGRLAVRGDESAKLALRRAYRGEEGVQMNSDARWHWEQNFMKDNKTMLEKETGIKITDDMIKGADKGGIDAIRQWLDKKTKEEEAKEKAGGITSVGTMKVDRLEVVHDARK
jgi:hypothetical protein